MSTPVDSRLFVIPTPEVGPWLLSVAVTDYLTETEEASEDIAIDVVAGIVTISVHWGDPEWYELLAAKLEIARPGTRCFVAYRKDWPQP